MDWIDWTQFGLLGGLAVAVILVGLNLRRHLAHHVADEREELAHMKRRVETLPPRWEEN